MTDRAITDTIVVVAGDVTIDWNLARTRGAVDTSDTWSFDDCTRACWQRGGAALLADVVEAVGIAVQDDMQARLDLRQAPVPNESVRPDDRRFRHSYAMWSPFEFEKRSPGAPRAWRVEEFLGHDHCPLEDSPQARTWRRVADDTPEASLVVLDDAGLGFRDNASFWPLAITDDGRRPWVLLKMAVPVAQGKLWEHLHANHGDRLIVIMTVDDLRRTEVQISRELSWERTAQDLFWEIVHNPRINALSRCAHVVVTFGTAGAVLFSAANAAAPAPGARRSTLFFDPGVIEGMWERRYPGGIIGYNTCMAAGIVRQLLLSPDTPNIHQSIQSGLAAMRTLHQEGYGQRGTPAAQVALTFPTDLIAAELSKDTAEFSVAEVQDPVRFLTPESASRQQAPKDGFWTVLEQRHREDLALVAEQVVLYGPEQALNDVPLGRFGKLLTVDRREIESFRSISALVAEYCRRPKLQKRPLSIAIFGPPGSGKSFGITQVAESLLPGVTEKIEFNLSQFDSVDDLLNAFHQVRDVGLGGRIPLVFWDEFDTRFEGQPLGWLRYFLAPMQDGRFQEGQVSHPIGRAIFVFAGGTSLRMADFGQRLTPGERMQVKAPDFVSRLKGYVDVQGPNRQRQSDDSSPDSDPYYIIRRAILLRAMLTRDAPQLLVTVDGRKLMNIDQGVLRAFLQTRVFKHGARSLEAIIAMSLLAGKDTFERSGLPAESQLNLHVNGQDFLALVQFIDLQGPLLEELARAVHEVFCEDLKAKGYHWGEQTDDEAKTHSSLIPYDMLPDDEQQQNRGSARDLANKLARTGYVMLPARSNEPPFNFPGDDEERLAEMEHQRWMDAKLEAGWQYATETDKDSQLHRSLVPWDQLGEVDRERDRAQVRKIPQILARVGYAIVRTEGEAGEQ